MNRKHWKRPGAALLAAALVVVGIGFRQELATWFLGHSASVHSDAAHYTCSMDPSVRSEVPGRCPICGMTLTPVSQADLDSDLLHVPPDAMRRIGGHFAVAQAQTVRKRILGYGHVVAPPASDRSGAVWIEARVYEVDPVAFYAGRPVTVRLPQLPVDSFEGSLVSIDIDGETISTQLRVSMLDASKRVQPGMQAEVRVDVDLDERLVVPARAIIPAGSRRIVFVDRQRERLEPRPVKTGVESDGMVEVWSGLAVGERVLVSGNFLAAAESRIRSSGKLWSEPKPKPRKRRTEPNKGGKPKPRPAGSAGTPPGGEVAPGSDPPSSPEVANPPGAEAPGAEAPAATAPAATAPAAKHPPGHRHPDGKHPPGHRHPDGAKAAPGSDKPAAPATRPSDAEGGSR